MERKGLRKRDILRIDGLLPPTRRLPVCDAVSGTSDKKKDKKWSIGGILRRISSIRDYDSSSNDEEIVYCKRTPRKPARFANGQANGVGDVVLHVIDNDSERGCEQPRILASNQIRQLTDSPHLLRDSLHSRSSDGSLDGLGRKSRRNKLKARAEAKRDHLCAESSSDEDCRQSSGSLNRLHGVDAAQNGQRSNTTCSRRTRAARTERYIKRMSRDDGNGGSGDTLNDCPYNRRCSLEYYEDKERVVDANGSCRPPAHPRRTGLHPSNRALSALETPSIADAGQEIVGDLRRYSIGQYVTDVNENDAYGRISCASYGDPDDRRAGNFFTYPAKHACHHAEPFDRAIDRRRLTSPDNRPPEPPPRDPRYRAYGYGSYPANRHQTVPSYFQWGGNGGDAGATRADYFRSYGSNNEIARYNDTAESTSPYVGTELRNSLEHVNNRCNSNRSNCPIEWAYGQTEAARCRLRNTRNDQLNDANHRAYRIIGNQSANKCEATASKVRETVSSRASACEQRGSVSPLAPSDKTNKTDEHNGTAMLQTDEEERRRSSRNLEEALSELEAIYNSLRLGDEDLLDRAERRSMEEFSLRRRSGSELDAVTAPVSPDRTKDDMAYRRMHPKERPTSLSDIAGQSTLAQISYLITSPVLARRDSADHLATSYSSCRRDEPDVTRDDVVFRSINHANNTLRVVDPQPPFGIPLGPVTAATESDYLHTTPTKPEQSRSLYIPQCEPDVVTDDLAYRALRKDALAARNGAGAQDSRINEVAREQRQLVAGKKRAVRSLSANLYGLINHDRIHLRREPNLDEVQHSLTATPERPRYLRRVVSDGELSDNEARRRKQPVMGSDIDINGNHPAEGTYRSKLGATPDMARESPKKEKESSIAALSDAVRSSEALDDEFWHEYLRSDSGVLASNGEHAAETDFTAYTRLCQDLVDLIKSDDDATPRDESEIGSSAVPIEQDDLEMKTGPKPLASIGSHRWESRRANAERKMEDADNAQNAQSAELTSTRNLDFYLRMADENVKLIAEAFGNVADHLRDSRLFARENSSASRASECQSGSTHSSTLYSQEDRANGNDDDQPIVADACSGRDEGNSANLRDLLPSNEGDQNDQNDLSENARTAELDLSRAVRDLQLAAASLYDHGQEIEDLGTGCDWIGGARIQDAAPIRTASPRGSDASEEDRPIRKLGLIADALRHAQQRGREAAAECEIGTRFDEKCRAGERTVCRELEDRVPDVTNSIVTKCSMLLLACLLALLLAIVAAS